MAELRNGRSGRAPSRRGDGRREAATTTGRVREAELLVAISRTIVSTVDFREALRRGCRELTRRTVADTGSVYVVDSSGALLVPQAAYHVPPEHLILLAATALPLTEQGFHLPGWRARQPVWSSDVARDPRFSHPPSIWSGGRPGPASRRRSWTGTGTCRIRSRCC